MTSQIDIAHLEKHARCEKNFNPALDLIKIYNSSEEAYNIDSPDTALMINMMSRRGYNNKLNYK